VTQQPATLCLRILQTTDLHMRILGYDYFADSAATPEAQNGLARLAPVIRAARGEVANCLLVDNGDFLQGTPMGDLFADPAMIDHTGAHPMIAAMNALGYDAATLGNHEFNYGLAPLDRALADADFPVIAGNITRAHGPALPPWVIVTLDAVDNAGARHPLRVGMIGLAPPQITGWDRAVLGGAITMQGICAAARAQVPQIRAAGADLVVALAHTGIGAADARDGMENAAVPLSAVDGIDAVLCGHQHQLLPGPRFAAMADVDAARGTIHGKPAMMPGYWGAHLGVMDLTLAHGSGGRWRVAGHDIALRAADTSADDAIVARAVAPAHQATLAHIRRPVGRTTEALHSYFTLIADDAAVQLVAEAQRARAAELLRGTEWADLPLLSVAAPFKMGGQPGPAQYTDVPAGPLTLRSLADLYLFPNTLQAVEVTGAQLQDWLERAAGIYRQLRPGQPDQPLRDPEFPAYNFDIICGLSYRIDPSQPARFTIDGRLADHHAQRITRMRCAGRPVAPGDRLIVATNSYRLGSSLVAPLGPMPVVLDTTESVRDILRTHIAAHPVITPPRRPVWRFAAQAPGTSALFDTGPGATAYLDQPGLPPLTPLGRTAEGFARFRLHM